MNKYRSHNCNELNINDIDKSISISGWINRKRDHGNLLFLDLRDHYGITQCVIDNSKIEILNLIENLRVESVVKIIGKVVKREIETINSELKTGEIEIAIDTVEVLSDAEELPMPVFGEANYPEDIRLKYRFLDARREGLHKNIQLRSDVIAFIRELMTKAGFLEMQTPILTASSPEGARDYLVPSRIHPGNIGSLIQIMMLRWLQKTGHKPMPLMGGGTTKIGDPSGKDESRQLITTDTINTNISGIQKVFEKYLTFGVNRTDAKIINNSEWLDKLNYIEFLRDIGKHFTINRMISMESVKLRLDREQPLTLDLSKLEVSMTQ